MPIGVAFLIQSADNPRLAPLLELADAAAALDPDESNYLDRLSTLTQAAVAASQAVEPVYDYLELFQDLRVDSLTGAILGDFDGFVARVLEDQPSFLMAGTFTGGGGPTLAVSGVDDRHPWTAWYQDQGALLFSVGQAMGYDDAYVLNVTGWRWLNSDMTDLHGTAGADLIDQAITSYRKIIDEPKYQRRRQRRHFGPSAKMRSGWRSGADVDRSAVRSKDVNLKQSPRIR